MLGKIDNALQKTFGLPYLYATRDFNIHSRCRYLLHKVERIEGSGLSLLDVGCGSGIALRHLAALPAGKIGRYVGIDLAAKRLQTRYDDIRHIKTEFHNIDLDDPWHVGQFDLVWCSEVIEHLLNDSGQIAKIKQAVKPGGTIVLTAPCLDFVRHMGAYFPPILKTSAEQDGGHVRQGYRLDDIARLAAGAGLTVSSIDGVNPLDVKQTRRRYTSRGLAWFANNVAMSIAGRSKEDFALGERFKNEPELYPSIGAELVRPAEQAAGAGRSVPQDVREPRAAGA